MICDLAASDILKTAEHEYILCCYVIKLFAFFLLSIQNVFLPYCKEFNHIILNKIAPKNPIYHIVTLK